jgi:hypothetical protein
VSVRRISVAGIGDSGGLGLSGALSVSVTERSVSIAAIRATISATVPSVSAITAAIVPAIAGLGNSLSGALSVSCEEQVQFQ